MTRPLGPILSDEDRDEIVARYSKGEKTKKIAEAFGIHESYPSVLARRAGVQVRKPKHARRNEYVPIRRMRRKKKKKS